jgi:thiosulfate dehydrogenase [quinone] large subunit
MEKTMATTTGDTDVAVTSGSRLGWTALSIARILIGFVFLWAFIDKLFALGFSTGKDSKTGVVDYFGPKAWINGAHVTEGYLKSSSGPLGSFFSGLGAQRWTDWVFMIGLAGIGLALMFGIGTKVAAWSGVAMLAMMYTTHAWPGTVAGATNPFLDEHIVYGVTAVGIVFVELQRQAVGLGSWWRKLPIVQKNNWLV